MSTNPTTDAGNIAGTPSVYANKAAYQIMLNTEAASQACNGPRFTFVEYQKEQAIEVQKAIDEALIQSREATAQAERERDYLRSLSANWKACADEYEKQRDESAGKLQEAQRQRDGRETDLMIALTDLAAETAKNAELIAQFGRIGEMIGDPLGGDFCQLESAIRDMAVFNSAVIGRTGCATEEGAIEWIEGAKTNESDLLKMAEERDTLRAYSLKLAHLLGCTDGDDSPELGIKDLIADRAELREKLAKAVNALTEITSGIRNRIAEEALAAIRGNDKAEKGAGELCTHDETDHSICLYCGEDRDPNSDRFGKKPNDL